MLMKPGRLNPGEEAILNRIPTWSQDVSGILLDGEDLDRDHPRVALRYETEKSLRLEVMRASYERAVKRIRQLAPSLALPYKSKDLASGSRKICRSKAAHNTLVSGRSREASPEDRGLAQKKVRTGILATDAEVVSAISLKADKAYN
ncbi:hypothetical protein ACFE04_006423 [Oxalis oulophora]